MADPRTNRIVRVMFWMTTAFLACTADGETVSAELGFRRAYVHDDCAPWDGAALTLVLAQEPLEHRFDFPYPSLSITSYRPPSTLAGGSFEWRGESPDKGHAAWCDASGLCHVPAYVAVRFDRIQRQDGQLTGSLRVELEDGRVASGPFAAERLAVQALCG